MYKNFEKQPNFNDSIPSIGLCSNIVWIGTVVDFSATKCSYIPPPFLGLPYPIISIEYKEPT